MRLGDLKTLAPSLSQFRRNMNLIRNFDANWYTREYPDAAEHRLSPLMHFIRYGLPENRKPSSWFDTSKLPASSLARKTHRRVNSPSHYSEAERSDPKYFESLRESDTLWIFFNVADNKALSGGMLSINRLVDLAVESAIGRGNTAVAVSGVPVSENAVKYTRFEQRLPMVHIAWIAQNTNPMKVTVFLPEVFAVEMIEDVLRDNALRYWFKSRSDLEIVVLNQNNELMPAPEIFNPPTQHLTKSIKITTAHPRYCTEALAIKFGLPVKQLTPVLPDVIQRPFAERKSIFLVSPDSLDDSYSGLTNEAIISEIQALLPEFIIIIVQDMTLTEYLELVSQAMFSITFGEGMDGYFIEPILSKGLSFAVYNDIFFPKHFVNAPTVAKSWPDLLKLIKDDVPKYLVDPDLYNRTSGHLGDLLRRTYSREISKKNFLDLMDGVVDFLPSPQVSNLELFDNLKVFLESERYFRFHNGMPGEKQVAITPDNLIVLHLGSEFYSVLYEIYERRDYDMCLDDKKEYVLIDIGANVGMASLYLRKRYNNIKQVFAFEPLGTVANIARKNFEANPDAAPIVLKQIGLSDEYSIKTVEFFEDWTTAFSTDDQTLDSFLKYSEEGSRAETRVTEIEVAPANIEIGNIFASTGNRRIALKCDTQGSEFAIFRSLDYACLFDRIDAIIVETHFRSPDEVIEILSRNGFEVICRCDHEVNVVYTIKASRIGKPE